MGCKQGIDQFPDRAVAAIAFGHKVNFSKNLRPRVGGSRGKAGDFHGPQVIQVVADKADVVQVQRITLRELPKCGCLVAASLGHVGDVHLGGVPVDEGTILAGDQRKDEACPPRQRKSHDVGEAEALELLPIRAPPHAAVGQDAVDVHRNGFDGLQLCHARLRLGHADLNRRPDAAELLDDGNFALVNALDAVAHRLLAKPDIAHQAADAVRLQ